MTTQITQRERRHKRIAISNQIAAIMFLNHVIQTDDKLVYYRVAQDEKETLSNKEISVEYGYYDPSANCFWLVLCCEDWPVVPDGAYTPEIPSKYFNVETYVVHNETKIDNLGSTSWRDLPALF